MVHKEHAHEDDPSPEGLIELMREYSVTIQRVNPYDSHSTTEAIAIVDSLESLSQQERLWMREVLTSKHNYNTHATLDAFAEKFANAKFVPWLQDTLKAAKNDRERRHILESFDASMKRFPAGLQYTYHGVILNLLGEDANAESIPEQCSPADVLHFDDFRKTG